MSDLYAIKCGMTGPEFSANHVHDLDCYTRASRSDVLEWLGWEEARIHYGPDDDWYDIKWCRKHDDIAKVYSDGSIGCWWEDVVEANGYHQDSDIVAMIEVLEGVGDE